MYHGKFHIFVLDLDVFSGLGFGVLDWVSGVLDWVFGVLD